MSGLSIASPAAPLPKLLDLPPRQIASREPPPRKTAEEMKAAYLAAHPRLTPAQAFASNAETSPPNTSNPLASDYAEKLNTEISVNGKVIARIYNSGAIVIASEYSFLSDEIFSGGGEGKTGPALAEDRANRIKAALIAHGAVMPDDDLQGSKNPLAGKSTTAPVLQILKATTAQTQDQWAAEQAKQGPLNPGTLFSRAV